MWREEAKKLYGEGKKIKEISVSVRKSRKTVGIFLKTLPQSEHDKNTAVKEHKRKQYQREWDRKNRGTDVEYALVKRQHDIDVRVLSSERY